MFNNIEKLFAQTVLVICENSRLDNTLINSSNDRVVRASASGAVDTGLIPIRIKPMTLKLVFTASLLDAQH